MSSSPNRRRKSDAHILDARPDGPIGPAERRTTDKFEKRRADWRYGHVLYQIFVDRFAPSRRLDEKRHTYKAPQRLVDWKRLPQRGEYLPEDGISTGQLEFWGGDLDSLRAKLDYIESLGIDVVYLNPIFEAFSNHKYDGSDYFRIDPHYGTLDELRELADDLHSRGMRLMLDGVFNHMGRRSEIFRQAVKAGDDGDASHPAREFFTFGDEHKNGYLGWRNVANLPELNLENPDVRDMVYNKRDSVVRRYLREIGIDGWRLDVAPDLGFRWLGELTRAARKENPESVVIGECWNYPEEWIDSLDGVMNMHVRALLLGLLDGRLSPPAMGRALERMIEDTGIDGILKSHLILDNHDLERLTNVVTSKKARRLAWILHFTMPGCPVIYYGSELGMRGGRDPANRAPMRWDLAEKANDTADLVKSLVKTRDENPALRLGDFRLLESERLLAFLRRTDRARETIVVVANPTSQKLRDLIPIRDSRLMDAAPVECLLSGERVHMHSGTLDIEVPARDIRLFRTVDQGDAPGYSMFKRVP